MKLFFLPCLAVLFYAPLLHAQDYPNKTVRLIVPWAAGGSTDSIGRILGQKLAEYTNQQWIVDNRGGATGTIGHAWLPNRRRMATRCCWAPTALSPSRRICTKAFNTTTTRRSRRYLW